MGVTVHPPGPPNAIRSGQACQDDQRGAGRKRSFSHNPVAHGPVGFWGSSRVSLRSRQRYYLTVAQKKIDIDQYLDSVLQLGNAHQIRMYFPAAKLRHVLDVAK